MRKVQVTINVIMVADAAADGDYEHLSVYADANNVFEAVASSYQALMEPLTEETEQFRQGVNTYDN